MLWARGVCAKTNRRIAVMSAVITADVRVWVNESDADVGFVVGVVDTTDGGGGVTTGALGGSGVTIVICWSGMIQAVVTLSLVTAVGTIALTSVVVTSDAPQLIVLA